MENVHLSYNLHNPTKPGLHIQAFNYLSCSAAFCIVFTVYALLFHICDTHYPSDVDTHINGATGDFMFNFYTFNLNNCGCIQRPLFSRMCGVTTACLLLIPFARPAMDVASLSSSPAVLTHLNTNLIISLVCHCVIDLALNFHHSLMNYPEVFSIQVQYVPDCFWIFWPQSFFKLKQGRPLTSTLLTQKDRLLKLHHTQQTLTTCVKRNVSKPRGT